MSALKERRFPKIKGRDYFGVFPEWLRPDDWRQVPFTHTITQTTCYGLPHFNPGNSLYLVEDRAPQPGEMFIWCQKSFDGFPTAPVWGRFMASTAKGDKVLTTMGDVVVLPLGPGPLPSKADYAYRFRIVGSRHEDSDRNFARSEIPIPIPAAAEREDQAAEFDVLQHHVKTLDQLLHNMADIDDMMDGLNDAAKKAGSDDYNAQAHRQARAYMLTQIVLTAAMQQHQLIERQMTAFLASAPELAKRLAHWQSDDTARAT
jgi:hypothetical protein